MTHAYILGRGDVIRGVMLGVWILACDAALKIIARIGACGGEGVIDGAAVSSMFELPASCAGTELAGPSIRLLPHAREGMLLGLGGGMTGFGGQIYGLSLLFAATLLTILVTRWKWRANGDPQALAAIWAGGLIEAVPRVSGDGSGLAELEMFGMSTGVGDLALIWGLGWMAWRFVGELRA